MKKLFPLLLLIPFLFIGCVSTSLNDKEKVQVQIANDCAWAMGVTIRVQGTGSYLHRFTLGTTPKTFELYKDTDYVFHLKGTYDYETTMKKIHLGNQTYIVIDWDSYTGTYRIRGR